MRAALGVGAACDIGSSRLDPNPKPTRTPNQVSHEPLHRDLSVEARALLKTCLTSDAEARATAEAAQAHPWLK